MRSDWLSIRLSASESESVTVLRAEYELRTLKRTSIKEYLRLLIKDSLEKKRVGQLILPNQKTAPVLSRGGAFEHIAWNKNLEEDAILSELASLPGGLSLPYSQADVVRELIRIEFQIVAHRHHVCPRIQVEVER